MAQYAERFWVDFVFNGPLLKFAEVIDTKLYEGQQQISALFTELEGQLSRVSSRGKPVKLQDTELYHGNITFEFRYSSERRLGLLFQNVILPLLSERFINPILNSGDCAILENLYPSDYLITRATELVEMEAAVKAKVAEMNPDIPADFIEQILSARPPDAP